MLDVFVDRFPEFPGQLDRGMPCEDGDGDEKPGAVQDPGAEAKERHEEDGREAGDSRTAG